MELRVKGKRLLAVGLAVAMLLSLLPMHMLGGVLKVKAATTEKIVLFDDEFTSNVTENHASLTVVDEPNAAGNKVLQIGDNYTRYQVRNYSSMG